MSANPRLKRGSRTLADSSRIDLEMASTADDIVRIHRGGKIAALLGLEGGQLISDSLPPDAFQKQRLG
ncbi:MAG: hypothetical protein DMG58_35425 [Acidobacteria bacterium]|nr:MAG: hypothetical protein DMG58_35425 [Acidobacteriota bacterium]